MMLQQPTDETVMALWRQLPSETQDGREPDDIRPWVTAVLNAAARGAALPGEPVWTGGGRKSLTLELESGHDVEAISLGEADRPSEVARLLRRAADDIESVFRETTAGEA
jgi:hypothetical protein